MAPQKRQDLPTSDQFTWENLIMEDNYGRKENNALVNIPPDYSKA